MLNRDKLKNNSKSIIKEINMIIKYLQSAKKDTIIGSAMIDNKITDAKHRLDSLINKIHSYWE